MLRLFLFLNKEAIVWMETGMTCNKGSNFLLFDMYISYIATKMQKSTVLLTEKMAFSLS